MSTPSIVQIAIKTSADLEALRRAQESFLSLRTNAQSFASMFRMGGVFGISLMSVAGAANAITSAARAGMAFNTALQQNTIAFKTLLGSMDAAERRMTDLADFAASTPFELPEVVNASRLLQSLTAGAMASGDALRLVGDAAAAAGRPFGEAAMWIGRLYSGLQSGTPVGEATMRLLEMGLVSGETRLRLDTLAESGRGVGRAMEIIREAFSGTTGAMEEQAKTAAGLRSTLRDTLNAMAADAVLPAWEKLQDITRGILQALGAMPKALDEMQEAAIRAQEAALGMVRTATTEAARTQNLDTLKAQLDQQRQRLPLVRARMEEVNAEIDADRNKPLFLSAGPFRVLDKERKELRAEEEKLLQTIAATEVAIRRLESAGAAAVAKAGSAAQAERDLILDLGMFGPGNLAGENTFARLQAQQEGANEEDEFWRQQAIKDYQEQNRLLEDQLRTDEQRRAHAEAMAEAHREMIEMQSYTLGTQARFDSWQQSAAVDGAMGMGAGVTAGLQNSLMEIGTAAEQVGRAIQTSIGGALNGISSSIEGLIRGTMGWADAFANVGRAILDAVISAFAQMIAQMIVSFALQKVLGTALKKEALAVGASWHAAAVSASIATMGTAAGVGVAAFLAAQAAGVGAATGMQAATGFMGGGYTGDGPITQVAGPVHRKEFVFDAPAVDRLGVPFLEGLRQGDIMASAPTQAAPQEQSPMRVVIVDNRRDAEQLRRDPRFRSMIVDLMES
jgi:hypothetical protein